MTHDIGSQPILRYILDGTHLSHEQEPTKLPSLDQLAKQLGVSRGKLREDLIAAQVYGVVDMRPGDGTYVCPFDFYTAIRPLVLYSVALDKRHFGELYKVRASLELGFWQNAVQQLEESDYAEFDRILAAAERKLQGTPVEIPHQEHRDFHILIYSRLENPFVLGLLRAYWDAYEAVGLHRYFDLSYYQHMWSSHKAMIGSIRSGDYDTGREVLVQHFTLLEDRLQDGRHQQ
jgi:DNA-binding FadR family transcriptional regulator